MSAVDDTPREGEAARQRRLMASLAAPRADAAGLGTNERGERALRGLQAYRANAQASAARSLAAAHPTVQRLLGDENLEQLARELWRAQPPQRGDLAEWGDGLAGWIDAHEQLGDWPYLADCARLDWAVHAVERSADARLDSDSFARLGDTDPARLRLDVMPGVALIDSPWPIGSIRAAHELPDEPAREAQFEAVREAIAARRGECVVVSRQGWKALVTVVDPAWAHGTRAVLAGATLGDALEEAGEGFDFAAWLQQALRAGWLKAVVVLPD